MIIVRARADLLRGQGAPPGLVHYVHQDEEVESRDKYLHQPGPDRGLQQSGIQRHLTLNGPRTSWLRT